MYRRQVLSGLGAPVVSSAPWSSCKTQCSPGPKSVSAPGATGKIVEDGELEAMLMLKCCSGDSTTAPSLRRQHREMLRKLKGCMERTGADQTPKVASTCKSFEKDASKFSARKVSSGGLRSSFWASLGSGASTPRSMMGLLLTPRSACDDGCRSSRTSDSPRSWISEEAAESEAGSVDEVEPVSEQGAHFFVGAVWVASLCILVSVLTRMVLMAEVIIAKLAPEHFSPSRATRASEDAERLDGVLRTVILASCSFLAGMGLSALRPEVSALHSVLALAT